MDYLTLKGFHVDACSDPGQAEAMTRFRQYDCIVVDVQPGGEAEPATARVIAFARKRNQDVVLVLLSTSDVRNDRLTHPFIAFVKPVSLHTIVDAVRGSRAGSYATPDGRTALEH